MTFSGTNPLKVFGGQMADRDDGAHSDLSTSAARVRAAAWPGSAAQANLAPGRYIAVDLAVNAKIPPLTTFTIAKAASPARLPVPGARISAIEFGFRGPGRLHDGELVRFANHGFLVHMIIAVRARSAAGAHKIARLLKAGKGGQAQRLATGFYSFVSILTHGGYQQQVIRNRPGYWVLACFMDTQDHREHTRLGMERVIHIVR